MKREASPKGEWQLPKIFALSFAFLIHSADPQSVVIIVFARVVYPYVRPYFSKSSKTKQTRQVLSMIHST